MEDQIQETPEVVEEQVQEPVKPSIENNLIAMRKKLEAEEEARRAAERRLQEIEQRYINSIQPQHATGVPDSSDDDFGADPDDFLQVKQYKKTASKFSSKLSEADRKLKELNEKLARLEAESALSSLKDFDQVVTDDNMKTLARLYPDDYETMMSSSNLKAKSRTAYNMIKKYKIIDDSIAESEARVAANKKKPSNPSNQGQTAQTPLSKLHDYDRRVLTDADRDRILANLERVKRGG